MVENSSNLKAQKKKRIDLIYVLFIFVQSRGTKNASTKPKIAYLMYFKKVLPLSTKDKPK